METDLFRDLFFLSFDGADDGAELWAKPHTITATLAADTNFASASGTAPLTVTQIAPVFTFSIPNHIYGDAPVTLNATSTSHAAITYSVLSGPATIVNSTLTITGVGPVVVQAAQQADTNHLAGIEAATFNVSPAALTITASSAAMIYGGAVPAITPSYSAFAYSDTPASLGTVTCSTTALSSSPAGSYTSSCTGAVNASNGTITYAIGSTPLAAGATPAAGTYTVTATFAPNGATASDFTNATATTQLTITPIAAGTLTLGNISASYGAGLTAAQLSAQLSGIDAGGMGTTTYSISGTTAGGQPLSGPINVGSIIPAGTYTVTATFTPGGANCTTCSNFTAVSVTSRLTVAAVPLTITASSLSTVYGSALPAIAPIYTGLTGGDSGAGLPTQPICTTTATSASNVGAYPTSCSGAADPNYVISYSGGTLTVTPATLTVAANPLSVAYGGYNGINQLTYTVTGFQLGQTAQTDLFGFPIETSNAPLNGTVGNYIITMSQGFLMLRSPYNKDYTIVYQTAPLVISPAVLSVVATSQTSVYGSTDPDHCGKVSNHLTYTITGFANGQNQRMVLDGAPLETTTVTPKSGAGVYPITITQGTLSIEPMFVKDYTLTFVNGSVTVTPAQLTVVANSYSRSVGQANPAFSFTITGFVNGDTQATALIGAPSCCTTAATAASPAGDYTIAIGSGSLAAVNGNYTINFVNGVLIVYQHGNPHDPHCDGRGNYSNNFGWDRNNWPDPSSFQYYWGGGGNWVVIPWGN